VLYYCFELDICVKQHRPEPTNVGDVLAMPLSHRDAGVARISLKLEALFLEVLARKFARQDILLVLDSALTIAAATLRFPVTSRLSSADSPELNPKENL